MQRRKTIGYERARGLMRQLDWKLRVTMKDNALQGVECYHPKQKTVYTVRRDSYKRLYPECRLIGRGRDDQEAILCYDHDGSNESLI